MQGRGRKIDALSAPVDRLPVELIRKGKFAIQSDNQFYHDFFSCRICLEPLDYDQECMCANCHALFCFKCLAQCLAFRKECIYKCRSDTNYQFAKPPLPLVILHQTAVISCDVCQKQFCGNLAFKNHNCRPSDSQNLTAPTLQNLNALITKLEK